MQCLSNIGEWRWGLSIFPTKIPLATDGPEDVGLGDLEETLEMIRKDNP